MNNKIVLFTYLNHLLVPFTHLYRPPLTYLREKQHFILICIFAASTLPIGYLRGDFVK